MSYWDYKLNVEQIEIPKCICGKYVLKKGEGNKTKKSRGQIGFKKSCGDSNCLKKIQSIKHIEYMKNNPGKTAWRLSNMSYPEKLFLYECKRIELCKKHLIVREYSVFPYFIDFAFVNERVAVEIDGSQHLLPERIEKDKIKDEFLKSKNWKVIRIPANNIIKDITKSIEVVMTFVKSDIKYEKIGFFEGCELKEKKYKNQVDYFDSKRLENYNNIHSKKIKMILESDIDFSKIGWVKKCAELLNVRHSNIKKWMKKHMHEFYDKNCYKTNTENRKIGINHYKNNKLKAKEQKNEKIQNRINQILNSGIDFNKRGWLTRVSELLLISKMSTIRWIKKYMPDLYENNLP